MADTWTDHVEVSMERYGTFSVAANIYGENPVTGRYRWGDWHREKGLKTPGELKAALLGAARLLNRPISWPDTIPKVATVDWLSAAVIADSEKLDLPDLPVWQILNEQRSFRRFGPVHLSADFSDDLHTLSIPLERWLRILAGELFSASKPYVYEGEQFLAEWSFRTDHAGTQQLEVTYDDSGVAWSGDLESLTKIEGLAVDGTDVAMLALRARPKPSSAKRTPGGREDREPRRLVYAKSPRPES